MPKLKTKSSAKKRFKITARGQVLTAIRNNGKTAYQEGLIYE